jgi:hypothetical protein
MNYRTRIILAALLTSAVIFAIVEWHDDFGKVPRSPVTGKELTKPRGGDDEHGEPKLAHGVGNAPKPRQSKQRGASTKGIVEGHSYGDNSIDASLPKGVQTTLVTDTPLDAVFEQLRYVDLVYTWVNGSDPERLVTKALDLSRLPKSQLKAVKSQIPPTQGGKGHPLRLTGGGGKKAATVAYISQNFNRLIRNMSTNTFASRRDRENDELRFSIRSVEQFLDWHQGRIIIVTPGAIPDWLSRTALLTSRTRSRAVDWLDDHPETRQEAVAKRIMVVHQDAILPWRHRFTFNTNTIEPNIFRLNNLTNMFIQFNDDYFVLRNTTVSTFFNKYGGSNLLLEPKLRPAIKTAVRRAYENTAEIVGKVLDRDLVVFAAGTTEEGPKRYEVKHAPFVYCKNMLQALYQRLQPRLEAAGVRYRQRSGNDTLTPFLHHTFSLDAPWRASEPYRDGNWTPYLGERKIVLDARNGCPPATAKIGGAASSVLYRVRGTAEKLATDLERIVEHRNPIFLTLNDDMSQAIPKSSKAEEKPPVAVMREVLAQRFSIPSRWEGKEGGRKGSSDPIGFLAGERSVDTVLLIRVSDLDFVCPSLRSLKLALPQFDGRVVFLVLDEPVGYSFPPADLATSTQAPEDPNATAPITHVPRSSTMDLPSGKRDGLRDHDGNRLNLTTGFFVPCHIRTEFVVVTGSSSEEKDSWRPDSAYVRGTGLNHTMERLRTRLKNKENSSAVVVLIESPNPVFGQTVAYEDLFPVDPAATVGKVGRHFVLDTTLLNLIEGPAPENLMQSFRLPHSRFEYGIPVVDDNSP